MATAADLRQLSAVVTVLCTVLIHAVENDLTGTFILYFSNPVRRLPVCGRHFFRVARVLVHLPSAIFLPAVYANYDTLRSESCGKLRNQVWILEGRRVYGDLVGAPLKDIFGVGLAPYSAGDAEGNVED